MHDFCFETINVTGKKFDDMLQNRVNRRMAYKQLLESTTFIQDGELPRSIRQEKDLFRRPFGDDCVLRRHFRYA